MTAQNVQALHPLARSLQTQAPVVIPKAAVLFQLIQPYLEYVDKAARLCKGDSQAPEVSTEGGHTISQQDLECYAILQLLEIGKSRREKLRDRLVASWTQYGSTTIEPPGEAGERTCLFSPGTRAQAPPWETECVRRHGQEEAEEIRALAGVNPVVTLTVR